MICRVARLGRKITAVCPGIFAVVIYVHCFQVLSRDQDHVWCGFCTAPLYHHGWLLHHLSKKDIVIANSMMIHLDPGVGEGDGPTLS